MKTNDFLAMRHTSQKQRELWELPCRRRRSTVVSERIYSEKTTNLESGV